MNYVGQDSSQIQFAVKELSRGMAKPTENDGGKLKRLIRLLQGFPGHISHYTYQCGIDRIVTWQDTDSACCKKGRKSTPGGMMMLGTHAIKSWSTSQAVMALSSGGTEYHGRVEGLSQSMGLQGLADDLGAASCI